MAPCEPATCAVLGANQVGRLRGHVCGMFALDSGKALWRQEGAVCHHRRQNAVPACCRFCAQGRLLSNQIGARCRIFLGRCSRQSLLLFLCEDGQHEWLDRRASGNDRDHLDVGSAGKVRRGGAGCMTGRRQNHKTQSQSYFHFQLLRKRHCFWRSKMRTMRSAARSFFKNSHFTPRRFFTQSTI